MISSAIALALGSVHALQRELAKQGIVSKLRTYSTGRTSGGGPFSRGALFHMLRNRIYLGQIVHKDQVFEGEHDGIVEPDLFTRVQCKLDGNARRHRTSAETRVTRAPLTGKLFDANGEAMTPSFSHGRTGQVYRYYVSASLQQGADNLDDDLVRRLPAPAFESAITDITARWLPREQQPLDCINAARITDGGMIIECSGKFAADIAEHLAQGERIIHASAKLCRIHTPIPFPLRGGQRLIISSGKLDIRSDQTLIAALRRAHSLLGRVLSD